MNRRNLKMRMLSFLVASTMLSSIVLPQNIAFAQTGSSSSFTADEVNRILASLTPEQKEQINKLTGSYDAQKIHIDSKELRSTKKINVIVRFNVEPAKIQMIEKSLAQGGVQATSQAFAADYAEAQKRVEDSHDQFKNFVKTQVKTEIVGGETVKTSMSILREYTEAFNGVTLSLSPSQLSSLSENSLVNSIWPVVNFETSPETTVSTTSDETTGVGKPTSALTLMGIDKLQAEGYTGIIKSGPRAGQKIKVGVLDTGIDYNHPDLKAVYKGGHDLINNIVDSEGNVTYVDDHDPMETIYPDWLEAKDHPNPNEGQPPANYKSYITSHGTHVSGTIAANTTDNNGTYSANGVSPNVDLYGYRVLGPGGHGSSDSVLSGIDQSVKDDMDVINLSLGANINDPLYPTSIAINNATLEGVVCAVAAGNAGPGQATVGSPGTSPFAITVGASTIPEEIPTMTLSNGSSTFKARLFGNNFALSDDAFKGQTLPIVDVGLGSTADYEGLDLTGKIALVHRGIDYLNVKMTNAKNSGAAGMIIWDNQADEANQGFISANLGKSMDNIYAVSLTQAQGQALSDAVKKDPENATITFPATLDAPVLKSADELASFSSTGPVKDWNIKPDVVAPGVNINSTAPYDIWESQDNATHDYRYAYQLMSGTSMATPHVAGIVALVLAAHPDYTPADVKTALMNTAKDINTDAKKYSVYQVGAGRVDPTRAIKSDVKIQVLDKATTIDSSNGAPQIKKVDNLTGSMFFGFKGRGEGATNGSDDVVQTKDFNVNNQGTSSKKFNVSTQFISTKFALSNPVGPGTGNNVKVDISTGGTQVTSIDVNGGSTVNATAKITVPANAIDGTYEGYINLVNAADSTESYRIPFTITVAEKGIDFKVNIKAFSPGERYTGNWSPQATIDRSAYSFSVNSGMESIYIVVKDKDGNYLGLAQDVQAIDAAGPGVQYGPMYILGNGLYLPFTKPYNGTLDQSGIGTTPVVLKEGAYSLEIIATDASAAHYTAEDTVYVDYTAPTITMDTDAKPGIYEIDPTGYLPGQEIKGFYGTVYDSNIEIMKNNGETSMPNWADPTKPTPVDQSQNAVWGYEGPWPVMVFQTDAQGRFHFGVTPEDITPEGKDFRVHPVDYAGSGDIDTTDQQYHFIKKGSPYITLTNSGGVDSKLEDQGKIVVEPNKSFNATIVTQNGKGMIGGKFTINDNNLYTFSNIRLSQEYSQYLAGKGITPSVTVGQPYDDTHNGGHSTDITIEGIGATGALDQDMNIIEADVSYTNPSPIVGPAGYEVIKSSFTYSDGEKEVANFNTNYPWVKMPTSLVQGGLFAESFLANNLSGSFTNIIRETGGKVTLKDSNGNVVAETDKPTSTDLNSIQPYLNQTGGTYRVTAPVSDNPYNAEISMPGHFKDYFKTPVIGSTKYGYRSGYAWDRPSYETPLLLGGDVNGDNVIDMNDLIAEIQAYVDYQFLFGPIGATTADKVAFFTNPTTGHRNNDIFWTFTGQNQFGGYSYSRIDYNDFYFILNNFGKVNQSAVNAGISVPTPQLTVPSNLTLTSNRGSYTNPALDSAVKTISITAGDDLNKVIAAINFAGPTQQTSVTQMPTLTDLKNGSSIELVPTSTTILDDLVWRKAITKIELGLKDPVSGVTNYEDVTNKEITNTTDKAVTINAGYRYFDPYKGYTFVPSKIKLHGSLFATTGNYTVRISAAGYQPVTRVVSIADIPIKTPDIQFTNDPSKAHVGKDLTYTFTDDANWREGINKIVVKTQNWSTGIDITNLKDNNGNLYYDISQPGKITFKAGLFKTNATPVSYNSPIMPDGTNNLNQNYKFDVSSNGKDGTQYPTKTIGDDNFSNGQPVGYTITFDTKGGSLVDPLAFGYRPDKTKVNPTSTIMNQITSVSVYACPSTTRNGYKFQGWYYFDPIQNKEVQWDVTGGAAGRYDSDITVFAKWQVAYTQNYSPVDKTKPDGLKFNEVSSNKGWVLGEGDVNITIPDYQTTTPLLNNIEKIEASYYKLKYDGTKITCDTTPTTYILDPTTYKFNGNADNSGTLSFTTATEKYTTEHPSEKFAFSAAPYWMGNGYNGYKVTITSKTGETLIISDVSLGYRRHIDLNGGTLTSPNDTYFMDTFVNGSANVPAMANALLHVKNGNLSVSEKLYLDSANSSGKVSDISNSKSIYTTDNTTYYLCWIKTPPTVSKDIEGNIVGSDITLKFTDDGIWKNNIQTVSIGSKVLVRNTDYTISDSSITLSHSLFTAGQKVNVTIKSEGYADALVIDQVIGHLVTFESNGGDSVASQIVDIRVTKPVNPEKVGYRFMGWFTDEALTTPFDFASIITGTKTLYAKYALATSIVSQDIIDNALGNDMTLEFSDVNWGKAITDIKINGTTVDKTKYNVNTTLGTITLDKSLFTKVGDFTINISAAEYADVTVTQKVVNGYNVQFILPSDAPTEIKDSVKDQIVSRRITEPVVYGYDLTWFVDVDCTIPWDFTNSIYSAKTLYAKWSLHKFTVIFNNQDGSLVESNTVDYNTTITEPTAPTREGYTFGGWYKDAECTTTWNFKADKVAADTILYAKWTINSYTVSFDSQGGSSVGSIKVDYNNMTTAPTAPTKEGYTFGGWYKDVECTTAWDFATDKVTADTTLHAKWTINSYTVSFDPQGGSSVDSIKVDYNTTGTAPTAPTREGYTFGGWYKDAECTTEWNFETDKVTVDTTLFAKWTANTVTPPTNDKDTSGDNGGTLPQSGALVGDSKYIELGSLMMFMGMLLVVSRRLKKKNTLK